MNLSNSGLLNPSAPLSPRPPVPSWVSASAGRLIDGCNGLSMDTAACQSTPAILTWLENSLPACLPACMAHKPEIGGERREITGSEMRMEKNQEEGK